MTNLTIDQKIAKTQEKIIRVRKWLKLTERATKRRAKREGWTKELTKQIKRINKDLEEIQDCQNELNICKADRKIQRRFMKK